MGVRALVSAVVTVALSPASASVPVTRALASVVAEAALPAGPVTPTGPVTPVAPAVPPPPDPPAAYGRSFHAVAPSPTLILPVSSSTHGSLHFN